MEYVIYVVLAIGAFVIGYLLRWKLVSSQIESAEKRAEKIVDEAKTKEKEILLKAQDKSLKTLEEAKVEEKRRRKEINDLQNRLEQRESAFSKRLLELQEKQQDLYDRVNKVEEAKEKIKQIKEDHIAKLQEIAGMDKEEAKEALFKLIESDAGEDLAVRIKKMENQADEEVEEKVACLQNMVKSLHSFQ